MNRYIVALIVLLMVMVTSVATVVAAIVVIVMVRDDYSGVCKNCGNADTDHDDGGVINGLNGV